MPLCQTQRLSPCPRIRLAVNLNRKLRQIRQRRIPEIRAVPPPLRAHLQNIRHFQPPESRNPRPALTQDLEYLPHLLRGLVAVDPCQRDGAIKDHAHAIGSPSLTAVPRRAVSSTRTTGRAPTSSSAAAGPARECAQTPPAFDPGPPGGHWERASRPPFRSA